MRRTRPAWRSRAGPSDNAGARIPPPASPVTVTHEHEELRDPERALACAERACASEEAANGGKLWQYLDTLALAQYLTGDTAAAVETQQRAISLMPSPDADPEMPKRLAEFEAALAASKAAGDRP
ncbi:MAG: hypothetical protein ACYTJ0_02985 [Planctomycetota bacterium]